jgi:hypothetical protein
MKCQNRHCQQPRADGSRFCATHRDQLAAIAAEIDSGKVARQRSHGRSQRQVKGKQCDRPGCTRPAAHRESYCAFHVRLLDAAKD